MARARGEMRDVELVEVPDETALPVAATGATPDGDRDTLQRLATRVVTVVSHWSPRARARARIGVLALVAVVLVLVVGSAVGSHRREAARLRTLAGVPGVLAPLDGPVEELWRVDGWPVGGVDEVAGRLVTVLTSPHEEVHAVALDPRTGDTAWRTVIPAGAADEAPTECVLPGAPWPDAVPERSADAQGPGGREDPPTRVEPEPAPVLVCVVADEVATSTEGRGLDSYTFAVRARLVTVDAVTGRIVQDRPVTPPTSVSSIGDDLLLADVDDRGHARVTRVHPRTGAGLWTFTSPRPVEVDQFGQRRVSVHTEGDLVLVEAGTVWALSPAGAVLREVPGTPDPFGGFTQTAGGGRLLVRSAPGTGTLTTELVDVASGRSTTLDGHVVTPRPDDRSLPDLVLLGPADGTGLLARDMTTGETRWEVAEHDPTPAVVLDGRVIGVDGDRIQALDGRTGAVVWTTTTPGLSGGVLVTDGRVAVAATAGSDAGATGRTSAGMFLPTGGSLVGVDVRDGRLLWSTELTEQPFLFAEDGRLFGYGRTGLVAFGPEPAATAGATSTTGSTGTEDARDTPDD